MMKFKQIIKRLAQNKQFLLVVAAISLAVIFLASLRSPIAKAKPAHYLKPDVSDTFVETLETKTGETISPAPAVNDLPTATEISQPRQEACPAVSSTKPVQLTEAEIQAHELRIPILMYHHIADPGTSTMPHLFHRPAFFESQLRSLDNVCFNTIFVSDVGTAIKEGYNLPARSVAITFDDGYEDMYTHAYPLLKKYKMKGTMYIIVNALDKPGYLTRAQVKEMADSGYVEIAAHTFDHVNLKATPDQKAWYEIVGCKKALEDISGKPVYDFAYPFGFFTHRDELLCLQAGYLTCASTYAGEVQTIAKRYSLFRLRPGYRVGPALINWLELIGPKN